MGTIIDPTIQGESFSCKDTIPSSFTAYWELNQNQDTLFVTYYNSFYGTDLTNISKISKLTEDTLVLEVVQIGLYPHTNFEQTNIYYAK
jgi:hypothetical protein